MSKPILGALVALAIMPSPSAAQATASAQGQAEVEVISPINISHISQAALRFGSLIVGATGTVRISGGGNVTASNGIDVIAGTTSLDAFTVTGEPGRSFSMTVLTDRPVVQSANNDQMPFAVEFPGGSSYQLNGQGTAPVLVGGTLNVTLGQRPGAYTGQYSVTATYE